MTLSHPDFDALRSAHRTDETEAVRSLLEALQLSTERRACIVAHAARLVERVRAQQHPFGGIDALLQEFSLSSKEGVALMCLAEAMLRVPDTETLDRFIGDTLSDADWERHLDLAKPFFVNAAAWALMLTGSVVGHDDEAVAPIDRFGHLISRLGRPVARRALLTAIRALGGQFILGRDIGEALRRATTREAADYRYSFDMLGESARGALDAQRYFDAYADAIQAIGGRLGGTDPIEAASISVKLSALHPRYEFAQRERVLTELVPRLLMLALAARRAGIGLTVDAEESERLELSLEVFAAVCAEPALAGWNGFGLAVQAYQKRAPHVIAWCRALARRHHRRIPVRLVKGAYWDSEIKRAQERGIATYPVYTRKAATDVSYLVCAQRLLEAGEDLFPQFATHNAHTVAAVLEMAGSNRDFEFQRLHGMGEALYRQFVGTDAAGAPPCRVYAPVGGHENLLAYLVRRLLENGANTSFVNRIADAAKPVGAVVADPVDILQALESLPHPRIPTPPELYMPERRNAKAVDLADGDAVDALLGAMNSAGKTERSAAANVGGASRQDGVAREILDPSDRRRIVGRAIEATPADIDAALALAAGAARAWDARPPEARAVCLDRMADALESQYELLMHLCVREAGKTIPDALSEVREAVDFCRYYAARARDGLATRALPGPTGESNELQWHGRGVWAAISPWNFPLAIFTGQVAAALVAGNCVLAKPAEQTPLIAACAVQLFHDAGIPPDVLHVLPGDGARVGARLVADPRIDGVVFTGSVQTALAINRTLAQRTGPIAALIAETGGQNAMLVDSTALPEQVVDDVLASAYRSAGQRCSALRVLFLQEEIAEHVLGMLTEAAAELVIGDPMRLATDIGPVIDDEALNRLQDHAQAMAHQARMLFVAELGADCAHGTFFAPRMVEITSLAQIPNEVFGPFLHVMRYPAHALDQVLDAIDATRYGLTLGIHTRIASRAREIQKRLRIGNAYVNRSMIGATVGAQPFGGEGWSGTGPKAGGPHYLQRMAVERVLSINTAAAGGNAGLAALE